MCCAGGRGAKEWLSLGAGLGAECLCPRRRSGRLGSGGATPSPHGCWGFLSRGSKATRGIPASDFLSQLLLGSCPAAPSPAPLLGAGQRASPHRMQIVGKFTSVSF